MKLRDKDRASLLAIFSNLEVPLEVWAYGSRVTGGAHDGSDLDLVVRTPGLHKVPVDVLVDLKKKIQESNIPIVVEVFDWARLPMNFQRGIEEQHEILFSNMGFVLNEPES